MTQLFQRNMAHRMLVARQGGNGVGNGGGNGGGRFLPPLGPSLSPTTTTPSASSAPALSPPSPPPSSIHSSTSSSVQSTTSAPPIVETTSTSSSVSTSTPAPTSKASSTTTDSSKTSSSILSTSSVPKQTTTFTPVNPIVNTNVFTPTTSIIDDTPTDVSDPGATSTVPSLNTSTSSNLSAGNIVGAVVGTLIGLALLSFLGAFVLRRYRRSRRRALHDSDFGTFRRSMFVTSRPSVATAAMPSMAESHHNVAPSLNEPYVPYSATTTQPPSQALASATGTTGGILQERPKYVYGQDPIPANPQRQHDDNASDAAHGGAYSSEPQAQSAYNAEAYGNYVKYEDVDNGIAGAVPAGSAVYQDAQRAYQGQQGYERSQYATYDQSQYEGYGQQQQHTAYGYPEQQQQHYQANAHANAYGGM